MDTRSIDRRLNDRGFSSIQFLVASGLALIFFAALANVVVVQYARGSMRSALDQGVRTGVVNRSVAACESRIQSVSDGLIGGAIGDTLNYRCQIEGAMMVARGSLTVESWTPFTTEFHLTVEAGAVLEPET